MPVITIRTILLAGTGTTAAVALMLAPRMATADHRGAHCETVSGQLEEDLGGAANCPPDHPGCFIGQIHGRHIDATTQFFGTGAADTPPTSPDWFSYSGVTTYTMRDGSITTRETGLASTVAIVDAPKDDSAASLSMEVITSGTGAFAGATGYLFVTGFVDDTSHVSSSVVGKICTP